MGPVRHTRISAVLLLVLAAPGLVRAQLPGLPNAAPPAAPKQAEQDPLGRDTPYSSVHGFLRAAERGEFARAAEYLEVKPSAEAAELAQQLQAILNVEKVVDLEALSRNPEGDLEDGLPPARERAGSIATDQGKFDILLNRVQRNGSPPIWLVSSETLRRVPDVYQKIDESGIERFVPEFLRETRVFTVPLYRWIGTLLGVFLALALAGLLTRLLIPLLRRATHTITGSGDDTHLNALRGPLRLILLAAGLRALGMLAITALGRQLWNNSAMVITVIGIAWLLIRYSDFAAQRLGQRLIERQLPGKLAVVALARRFFKIGVAVGAVLVLVYSTGKDITAILAGVGLGGIALALAAQKTLENLFGGISLISDEPIRVGDFCRIGNNVGIVEDIGLRSTRLRTLNRTILSIPNGQLSGLNIENFTLRDKILFNHKIGLRYETTPDQLCGIMTGIREMLRNHPSFDPEDFRVRLVQFGDSAFLIEIFLYLLGNDYSVFLETQEELLMRIMDIIVAGGSGFAFPSQTLYLAHDQAPPSSAA